MPPYGYQSTNGTMRKAQRRLAEARSITVLLGAAGKPSRTNRQFCFVAGAAGSLGAAASRLMPRSRSNAALSCLSLALSVGM